METLSNITTIGIWFIGILFTVIGYFVVSYFKRGDQIDEHEGRIIKIEQKI